MLIEEGTNALLCACCGESNGLHHATIDVFDRQEDATKGLHVHVHAGQAAIDTDLTGNPSARRDGIKITFWCELCGGSSSLSIAQHKGQEFIEMREMEGSVHPGDNWPEHVMGAAR